MMFLIVYKFFINNILIIFIKFIADKIEFNNIKWLEFESHLI